MKYQSLKIKKNLSKEISFCGGINESLPSTDILDNQLSDCLNVISRNGILKTRKGLYPMLNTVIGNYDNIGTMKKDFTLTKTAIFKNGIKNRIGYCVWGNNTYEKIKVYSLSPSGEFSSLDTISFTMSGNNLYEFDNAFFIVGKKTYGSGLYAFIKRKCFYNSSMHYLFEIYEYNSDLHSYRKMVESDYYTPVIYINGRGTDYEEAKRNGSVFTANPACPEELNLLGGRFCAYYTSDGYSSNFKLPISGLDFNKDFICRIYSHTNEYTEWLVSGGTYEATATFNGRTIKLNCDRLSGLVTFLEGTTEYAIPKTRNLNGNNICFISSKELIKPEERIIGSKYVTECNSEFFIYGNDVNKNEVFASKYETPLYFPETMKTDVGNATSKVVAIKNFKGNLLAFNSEGIFKITSAGEAGKLSYVSPVGISKDFSKPKRLSCSVITLQSGMGAEKTLCSCQDKLIWLKDRKVYFYSSGNTVTELSSPINHTLNSLTSEEINNAFSATFDGIYYLFFGNKALALNIQNESFGIETKYSANPQNNKNIAWFYLEFPEEINCSGAINTDNDMFLICGDSNNTINYISAFSDEKDAIINANNPTQIKEYKNILFNFKTKSFDFESQNKKNIIAIELQISGNSVIGIDIEANGYTSKQSVRLKGNSLSDIKVMPFFMPINRMSISLNGKGPITLKNANIQYNIP